MFDSKNLQHWIFSLKYIAKFAHKVDFRNSLEAFWGLHFRDGATVGKGWQVVMRRAAAARRGFLFCQNLSGRAPTLPTRFRHPYDLSPEFVKTY